MLLQPFFLFLESKYLCLIPWECEKKTIFATLYKLRINQKVKIINFKVTCKTKDL